MPLAFLSKAEASLLLNTSRNISNSGKAAMIAAPMTVTKERQKNLLFSNPFMLTSQLILTHKKSFRAKKIWDLADKNFAVKKSSSYFDTLIITNNKLIKKGLPPTDIDFISEHLETENIIELVSMKRYDFTIADGMLAKLAPEIFKGIYIVPNFSIAQKTKLAWAVSKKNKSLKKEIDLFLPIYQSGTKLGNINYKKYYRNLESLKGRYYKSDHQKGLSPYDHLIKKYSKFYQIDWRLMAAMAFQESRFSPKAYNKSGAIGLFQVKQMTANEPYIKIKNIKGLKNIHHNIHAGIKYFSWIKKRYFNPIKKMKEKDRLYMAIASYNAGPATILRARKLAIKMKLDPNKWFRHIESALLAMNKVEPVKYVSEINKHYISYVLYGINK